MNSTTSDSKQLTQTGLRLSALVAFVSALWLASPSADAADPPADIACDRQPSAPGEPPGNTPDGDDGLTQPSPNSEDTTTTGMLFSRHTNQASSKTLGPSLTIGLILGAAGLLGGLFSFLRDRSAYGARRTSESRAARATKLALSVLQGLVGALAALLLLVLSGSPVPECAGAHDPIDMLLLFGLGLLAAIGSKCFLGGVACDGELAETARNAEHRVSEAEERLNAALGNLRLTERDAAVLRAVARNGSRSMRSLGDIVRDEALRPIIDGMGDVAADVRRLIDGLVERGLVVHHEPSTPAGAPMYSPTPSGMETYMAAERSEGTRAGQPSRGATTTSISVSSPSGSRTRSR